MLFLCGILLSSVYTIGVPQSIPDSILVPSAFADAFFCPESTAGYYTTQIMIDSDFPTGEYVFKVTYLGKIVDAIAFTVTK